MNFIKKSKTIKITFMISFLITAFIFIGNYTHKWYVVFGPSMSPTINRINIGGFYLPSLAFVDTNANINKDDIVLFDHEGTVYIKRVDSLGCGSYIFEDDRYVIMQNSVTDSIGNIKELKYHKDKKIKQIKSYEAVVFGDNYQNSIDFKNIGPIKTKLIYGKVAFVLSFEGFKNNFKYTEYTSKRQQIINKLVIETARKNRLKG